MPRIAGMLVQCRRQGLLQCRQQVARGAACPTPHGQATQLVGVQCRWQRWFDRRGVDDQPALIQFQLPRFPQAHMIAVDDRHLHLHRRGAQVQPAPQRGQLTVPRKVSLNVAVAGSRFSSYVSSGMADTKLSVRFS